jgi:hypothetical protein
MGTTPLAWLDVSILFRSRIRFNVLRRFPRNETYFVHLLKADGIDPLFH